MISSKQHHWIKVKLEHEVSFELSWNLGQVPLMIGKPEMIQYRLADS